MSDTKTSQFKPFIRVIILSIILAFLLIYIGINYHWGVHLKPVPKPKVELTIPEKLETNFELIVKENVSSVNSFNPEIINDHSSNSLLDSMNKNQIADSCNNLLRKEIDDPLTLELATVNCVMSNFQETFQNSNQIDEEINEVSVNELEFKNQCSRQYSQNTAYSLLEKELLIGICVSDRMSTSAN